MLKRNLNRAYLPTHIHMCSSFEEFLSNIRARTSGESWISRAYEDTQRRFPSRNCTSNVNPAHGQFNAHLPISIRRYQSHICDAERHRVPADLIFDNSRHASPCPLSGDGGRKVYNLATSVTRHLSGSQNAPYLVRVVPVFVAGRSTSGIWPQSRLSSFLL